MDRMKTTGVHGSPAMLAAMALALTVNAAFVAALTTAGTDGQRIYRAWIDGSGDMYAGDPVLKASVQPCSRHTAARTAESHGKSLSWL